jgi:predicted RNA-binding Zn ribbon-like protein
VTPQAALLGSNVHDAAQRAADILAVVLPRAGNRLAPGSAAERAAVTEVLRTYGEALPAGISAAELYSLRQAAAELRQVFTAGNVAVAADRINGLLSGRACPPRLTAHGGASGWHVHVDGSDDAPWDEWFLTSSCLALAVLLAERQAPPAGICASPSCGRPFVNVGRGSARRYCSATCGTRERVAAYRAARPARPVKGL